MGASRYEGSHAVPPGLAGVHLDEVLFSSGYLHHSTAAVAPRRITSKYITLGGPGTPSIAARAAPHPVPLGQGPPRRPRQGRCPEGNRRRDRRGERDRAPLSAALIAPPRSFSLSDPRPAPPRSRKPESDRRSHDRRQARPLLTARHGSRLDGRDGENPGRRTAADDEDKIRHATVPQTQARPGAARIRRGTPCRRTNYSLLNHHPASVRPLRKGGGSGGPGLPG
jgi:hypothetical protein